MSSATLTTRLCRSLQIAGVIVVSAGLPFMCLDQAMQGSAVPSEQSEDTLDAEWDDLEFESSEVFVLCEDLDDASGPMCANIIFGGLARTEFALDGQHLERGPPLS
jgi:hypothetical protein